MVDKLFLCLMLFFGSVAHLQADFKDIFSYFTGEQKNIFATVLQEKKDQVSYLKEELQTFNKEFKEKNDLDEQRVESVNQKIIELEKKLEQEKEDQEQHNVEFYTELISIYTEQRRILTNIQLTRKQLPAVMEERVSLLQDYVKNPEFTAFAVERKAIYSIDVFLTTARQALDVHNEVKRDVEKQKEAANEVEKYKRELDAALKHYTEKKREQEEFKTKTGEVLEVCRFDIREQGQLIDAQVTAAHYEQELAQLHVQLSNAKKNLSDTQLFLAQEKEQVLKNNLSRVKSGLRIDEADLITAQEQLEKSKRVATQQQNTLFTAINSLTHDLEESRKNLEALIKEKEISASMLRDISEWNFQPKNSTEYGLYTMVALQQSTIAYFERSIEVYNAQIELEKARVRQQETHGTLLHTWFTLKNRAFKETDDLVRETKKFKILESELEKDSAHYQEKRSIITAHSNQLTTTLNTITELKKQLAEQKFLRNNKKEYQLIKENLDQGEKLVKERIAKNNAFADVYIQLIATIKNTLQDLKIMIAQLETKAIWQRSEYAISWQGIKNIMPDIHYFVSDVSTLGSAFFAEFSWNGLITFLHEQIRTSHALFMLIIRCLLLLLFFFVVHRGLPRIESMLLSVKKEYHFISIVSYTGAVCIRFISEHLVGIYIWTIFFMAVVLGFVPSLFLRVLFYLFSIPFLLYLVGHFITHFITYNAQHGYVIFPQSFERRFSIVFALLSSVTIILLFFRQAFMIATVHKSELPTILLAVYSILAIIFLLFSIGKEEIIALLPRRGSFWIWLSHEIDRFYYPMLALITCIMIISDPYVGGYKNLTSYILWGSIYTILLIWALAFIHRYLKNVSQVIFFSAEQDAVKDRFMYARTCYGLFAITSFFAVVLAGLYIGFTIWGFPISIERITEWFNVGLLPIGYDKETGHLIYVTPYKVFAIIGIIIGSFIVSSLVNRYILGRIFALLPVDLGIQNTVMSITRFLIVMLAVLIGFLWADLGTLLIAIGLVIGSIGYIVKEPISDFVSYFIILVQRPIQIGDYVELTEDHTGVVRRITPRSVILRRFNSYTIIVPNSMFITRSICNWNYARNYIAFDDIFFTIPYKADPELVKGLVKQVLDENLNILKSPAPIIRLSLFAENGFVFLVRGFLTEKNILNKWDIASDIRFGIVRKLREHGIHFALPTRYIVNGHKQDAYELNFQQEHEREN